MLHCSLQNITTCSYCKRYRQSTVYIRRVHTYRKRLSHLQHMVSFFLNSFPLKTCRDVFKIEIAEQFVQIKWKVLHSPCSNFCPHLQQPLSKLSAKKTSSQLSFSLFQFFFFWWVGTSKTTTLLFGAFFTEVTDLVAPQRIHLCSNAGIKDFQWRH